jgi:NitT/TauT family transport system substrate-binding protein
MTKGEQVVSRRLFLIAGCLLAAIVGSVPAVQPAAAQETVNFRLDFRLSGYHLPFYWAKAKGYYGQSGLAVNIKEGSGSGQTVNLVSAREADIGLADFMLMANGISKGMQIKGVYGLLQKNPWAVISYQDAAIKTPKDLEGRSVAVIADHRALLELLLKKNNVPSDKLTVRVVNVATRNTVFAEGKVDSFVSVSIGSPTDLVVRARQGKGKPLHFMHFSDFGVAPMGQGLLVHTDYLAKNAETIRKFIAASNKAIAEVSKPENLEEALDIALKETGANAERRDSLRQQWHDAVPTFQTENSKGHPLGWMSDKDWQETVEILQATGYVAKPPPVADLYTNDLIPKD